jgi:hypothetical protein
MRTPGRHGTSTLAVVRDVGHAAARTIARAIVRTAAGTLLAVAAGSSCATTLAVDASHAPGPTGDTATCDPSRATCVPACSPRDAALGRCKPGDPGGADQLPGGPGPGGV